MKACRWCTGNRHIQAGTWNWMELTFSCSHGMEARAHSGSERQRVCRSCLGVVAKKVASIPGIEL